MIAKIKDLMKIRELIDEINENVGNQEKAVKESTEQLKMFKKCLTEMDNEHKKALKGIKKDTETIREFRDDLKKELYEFRLFKKEIKKQFREDTEKELSDIKNMMRKDITDFNQTKRSLDTKLSNINRLEKEIDRLIIITSNIKAADFELARNQKLADNHNKEKIEFVRKIDHLERLVAKMRRRR